MSRAEELAAGHASEHVPGESEFVLWSPDGQAPTVGVARQLAAQAFAAGYAAGRKAPGRKARQEDSEDG